MGICAFFYMLKLFSVVVSTGLWFIEGGGWGQCTMGICVFFYM